MVLASRVFAGVCGGNITAAQAAMADITSDEERTAGMGMVGMALGLGFALGPVIGGAAAHGWELLGWGDAYEFVGPGVVATVICGVNLLIAFFQLPETLPPERRGKSHFRRFATVREMSGVLRHRITGPLILLTFIFTFAFSNLEVSFSLFARTELGMEDLEQIFGLFTYLGLVMAFVQGYLVRKLVKRVPEPTLMIAGLPLIALGLVTMPVVGGVPAILGPLTLMALGQGIASPSVMSLISRSAGQGEQGRVLGTSQSLSALARIVGPCFAGVLFDVGAALPFWLAAAIMVGAAAWGTGVRRRIRAEAPALELVRQTRTRR